MQPESLFFVSPCSELSGVSALNLIHPSPPPHLQLSVPGAPEDTILPGNAWDGPPTCPVWSVVHVALCPFG